MKKLLISLLKYSIKLLNYTINPLKYSRNEIKLTTSPIFKHESLEKRVQFGFFLNFSTLESTLGAETINLERNYYI